MARYLLLALNGPTGGEGDEEALNRWYDEVHIPGFKAIPEVKSARRYKTIRGKVPEGELWPYVTAYEIETDDLAAVSARMQKELMDFHPALDRETSGNLMAIQISGVA
ncbi:MAG: hypothetical protein ABW169_12605 [Sphingobium sp.]